MGLGLAHSVFVQTNAMLALSRVFKFSAKNITHLKSVPSLFIIIKGREVCPFYLYLFIGRNKQGSTGGAFRARQV